MIPTTVQYDNATVLYDNKRITEIWEFFKHKKCLHTNHENAPSVLDTVKH